MNCRRVHNRFTFSVAKDVLGKFRSDKTCNEYHRGMKKLRNANFGIIIIWNINITSNLQNHFFQSFWILKEWKKSFPSKTCFFCKHFFRKFNQFLISRWWLGMSYFSIEIQLINFYFKHWKSFFQVSFFYIFFKVSDI